MLEKYLTILQALRLLGLTPRTVYDWPPEKRPPFKMRVLRRGRKAERSITMAELWAWTRAQERMPEGGRQLTAKAKGHKRYMWPE